MASEVVGRKAWPILGHSARTAVAAVASLLAARLFQLPETYWAPITTIVITQSSLGAALAVSWQRFVGTAFGAAVGALVASHFGPHALVFGASVFALGLLCAVTNADRSAYRFGGIALAIVLLVPRTRSPWQIAFHRFAEVSIGIGVALIFAVVWPEKEATPTGENLNSFPLNSDRDEKVMEKIKLDPETSALILIDLQHGIMALETRPYPASLVVAKAASLAATFRKHNSPVMYVRVDLANMLQVPADRSHGDPKNPPPAIASELVPASGVQPGDLVVTKRHWSAFSGTDLEERLKRAGVKTVVIGGITTNYGVESTARAAAGLGFGVVFVEDATTSISAEAHQFAFATIFPMLGRVRKTSEVIEALA